MPTTHSRPRDLILGVLFFGVLTALVVVTTQLRNWPGTGTRHKLTVLFEDVYGAQKEDRVLVHGTTYGRVLRVVPIDLEAWKATGRDLAREGLAPAGSRFMPHVMMVIELDYPLPLHQGFHVFTEDANLLGGKLVSIDPGPSDAPEHQIGFEDDGDLDAGSKDDLAKIRLLGFRKPHPITAIGELVDDNKQSVKEILQNLKEATAMATDGKRGLLGLLLADAEVRDKGRSIIDNVSALVADAGKEGSLLHDFMHPGQLRKDVVDAVGDIRGAAADLRNPDTAIGGLLTKDSPTKRNIDTILENVRGASEKLHDSDSLVGRLFAEGPDSLGSRFDTLVGNINKAIDDGLANKDSVVYALFYGDLGKSVNNAFVRLDEAANKINTALLDPIKNREGVLGMLINDPDAKKKMERLISATLGIVEDAREAAPVTSLGSFIFGGF